MRCHDGAGARDPWLSIAGTNDIFLLAARALAGIIQQYQANGGDLAAAEAAYSVVFKAPWWEVRAVHRPATLD
jgi:hypothetical protein